jgi:hypothetical protein
MKKILLLTSLLLGVAGLHAQSKQTSVVSLTTGMTAQLELNSATTTATLTFTGPSDRWFALQLGSFTNTGGMSDGKDVIWYDGTTLVDGVHNGVGNTPSTDTNDWTVSSNSTSGTTRTIVATRAFNTGSSDDYTFVYANADIDFAWAKNTSASYTLAGHGSNRGYDLNNAFSCVAPAAPLPGNQTLCAGATIADLDAAEEAGATVKWYANATGGSPLAGTTALVNGTTYHVSQTVGDCESARTSVVVTLTTVALPSVQDETPEFCSEATISDLTATGAAGATFAWYANETGGAALAGSTVLTAGDYFVSQTVSGCESARREVNVSYVTLESPGVTDDTPEFCSQATVSDLQATGLTGATISWYADAVGGSALTGATVLVAGDYFVSQTLNGCVSDRVEVNVTYTTLANPSVPDTTPAVCEGTTIANLTVTGLAGATFNWYAASTGGSPLAGTTGLATGVSYFVSQTVGDCVSNRLEVVVTIAPLDEPVAAAAQSVCEGTLVSGLDITVLDGAVLKVSLTDGGTALTGNEALVAGSYFATQTLNGCESDAVETVVTLLPAPAAPAGDDTQDFDTGDTVADLVVTSADGATVNWYVMDGEDMEPVATTTVLVDGTDYYATQTLGGCESATFKVTVNEILGTPSFDLASLSVYPNPVTDMLTVSNKDSMTEITIINLLGQTVISQKSNSDKVEINTSRLQSGSYILRVYTSNGTAAVKIIK